MRQGNQLPRPPGAKLQRTLRVDENFKDKCMANDLQKWSTEMSRRVKSHLLWFYYRASICEGVLGVVILSVRLSVTRVDCDKSKWCTADIFIPHERAITLLLWHQQWLVGDAPFPLKSALKVTPFEKRRLRQISAHNVSTVRDSEKSSIITNIKSTTGFSTSHRWSAYVTPKSRKGGSKSDFFVFWAKVNDWSSQALST